MSPTSNQCAFLDEAVEHLEVLTQSLLEIDNAAERGERITIEMLNSAFRSAMKGMAASMGFHCMERVCHALEEVLDALRERLELTTDVTDVLLECASFIEMLISKIARDGSDESADISSILRGLEEIIASVQEESGGAVGAGRGDVAAERSGSADEESGIDDGDEMHGTPETDERGARCYEVCWRIACSSV